MFFRYDPQANASQTPSREATPSTILDEGLNREFLFFGDVESDWRRKGEEGYDKEGQESARTYNMAIWSMAAESWDAGRLAGIFVSCHITLDGELMTRLNVLMIRRGLHI